MNDADALLTVFAQIQDWPEFKQVEQLLVGAAGQGELFLGPDGALIESEWVSLPETIPWGDQRWETRIYKSIRAAPLAGSQIPIPFTALRIVPPDDMKQVLRACRGVPDPQGSPEHRQVMASYSMGAIAPSPDYLRYLVGITSNLEQMLAPRDYLFVPSMAQVGLVPHFDYDVVMFFISGMYLQAARSGA